MDEGDLKFAAHSRHKRKATKTDVCDTTSLKMRREYTYKNKIKWKRGESKTRTRWKSGVQNMKTERIHTLKRCSSLNVFVHVNPSTLNSDDKLMTGTMD